MPKAPKIGTKFTNIATQIQDRRNEAFNQATEQFVARALDTLEADVNKVELPLQQGINPHIWDVVRQSRTEFESDTDLTIYDGKLMTVTRAKALEAAKPKPPPDIPVPTPVPDAPIPALPEGG